MLNHCATPTNNVSEQDDVCTHFLGGDCFPKNVLIGEMSSAYPPFENKLGVLILFLPFHLCALHKGILFQLIEGGT